MASARRMGRKEKVRGNHPSKQKEKEEAFEHAFNRFTRNILYSPKGPIADRLRIELFIREQSLDKKVSMKNMSYIDLEGLDAEELTHTEFSSSRAKLTNEQTECLEVSSTKCELVHHLKSQPNQLR